MSQFSKWKLSRVGMFWGQNYSRLTFMERNDFNRNSTWKEFHLLTAICLKLSILLFTSRERSNILSNRFVPLHLRLKSFFFPLTNFSLCEIPNNDIFLSLFLIFSRVEEKGNFACSMRRTLVLYTGNCYSKNILSFFIKRIQI